jgi:hypothetical protein
MLPHRLQGITLRSTPARTRGAVAISAAVVNGGTLEANKSSAAYCTGRQAAHSTARNPPPGARKSLIIIGQAFVDTAFNGG